MLRWKIETHSHTHMHAHTVCMHICTTDWVKNSKYLAFRPKMLICVCVCVDKKINEQEKNRDEDADTKANRMLAAFKWPLNWCSHRKKRAQTVRYRWRQRRSRRRQPRRIENDLFLVNGCVFGVSFRTMSHRCWCCCCCTHSFGERPHFGWHWTLFSSFQFRTKSFCSLCLNIN